MAILTKSVCRLNEALRSRPGCVHEELVPSRSATHIAVDWPDGLAILFNAGADCNSFPLWNTPLELALRRGNAASALICLQADCSLENASWYLSRAIEYDLRGSSSSGHHSMMEAIVKAIANRRRRLQQLAVERLRAELHHLLDTSGNTVLDEKAAIVQQHLEDTCVEIPCALRVTDYLTRSVYHCRAQHLSIHKADYLWNAGFRDVDAEDEDGRTPFSRIFHSLLVPWKYDRGEKQLIRQDKLGEERFIQQSAWMAWLYSKTSLQRTFLACMLSAHFGYALSKLVSFSDRRSSHQRIIRQLPKDVVVFLRDLLNTSPGTDYDSCVCACSLNGCVSLDRFFRGALEGWRDRALLERIVPLVKTLHEITGIIPELWILLIPRIIRVALFEWFGMSHSCCKPIYDWHAGFDIIRPDLDTVTELLEEQSDAIDRFEAILPGFIGAYQDSGLDLVSWLKGPFRERVDQTLSAEPVNAEEYAGTVFENVGIRLKHDDRTLEEYAERYESELELGLDDEREGDRTCCTHRREHC